MNTDIVEQGKLLGNAVVDVTLTPVTTNSQLPTPKSDIAGSVDGVSMFERWASDPNISVEKLERLYELYAKAEARRAEIAFNGAMSKAQKAIKAVVAREWNDQTKSRYPSYDALDSMARPVYTENGFALSFDTGEAPHDLEVRILCYVTHDDGHSRTYHIDMPADGKGARGGDVMTRTHATSSAVTYGMRNLLKMVFNMPIKDADDDGNRAGNRSQKPSKPEGYDAWFKHLADTAAKGSKAYDPAWECSDAGFKTYAANHDREALNDLKKTAREAGRKS